MISIKNIFDFLYSSGLSFSYHGDENIEVYSYVPIENIDSNLISWIKDEKKLQILVDKNVSNSLIVSPKFETSCFIKSNFIFCDRPKEVFFTILNHFFLEKVENEYISPRSIVEATSFGKNIFIGHNCYIGPDVEILDNVRINNNVCLEGKITIGKNTIINSGVIIGTDGFGYFQNVKGKYLKVPHFGGVIIGEEVEIGANTCIDRGTLGNTIIGNNVKINNHCHIAHNVIIEENVIVSALTSIAGSVHIKKNAYIAPSVSIRNQLIIGRNSLIGLGSVVVKDVEDNVVITGVPGKITRRLEVNE